MDGLDPPPGGNADGADGVEEARLLLEQQEADLRARILEEERNRITVERIRVRRETDRLRVESARAKNAIAEDDGEDRVNPEQLGRKNQVKGARLKLDTYFTMVAAALQEERLEERMSLRVSKKILVWVS